MAGVFYGVGVGPGDPELLTIKAIKVIQQADVIIAPKTEKKEDSVALTIASPYLKHNVDVVKLVFPMVFEPEMLSKAWEDNKNTILRYLQAGKKVVFLTLGDSMFYSTYIYIFRLLEDSGYPIQTVPGVTAFSAIGSRLGYPLVEGDNMLSIIPATMEEEKIDQALAISDQVVLMKVYKNFPQIVDKLQRYGMAQSAVMISRCGLNDEQIVENLDDLSADYLPNYLSTILARRPK